MWALEVGLQGLTSWLTWGLFFFYLGATWMRCVPNWAMRERERDFTVFIKPRGFQGRHHKRPTNKAWRKKQRKAKRAPVSPALFATWFWSYAMCAAPVACIVKKVKQQLRLGHQPVCLLMLCKRSLVTSSKSTQHVRPIFTVGVPKRAARQATPATPTSSRVNNRY